MKKLVNPFPTTGYYGPEYFCDRKIETENLLNDIVNGHSVTLTAIRRMGKTGLLQHVIQQLPDHWTGIYVDILWADNMNDFLNILISALVNGVPEKTKAGKLLWEFVRTLRPTFTFDGITGFPQVTIDVKPGEADRKIEQVFNYLEQTPTRILIAIDEFQQILNFPEKNTDAWLRSIIQRLHNINFIFCGSQQHIMMELFNSPSRPFFRSAQFMKLNAIDPGEYRKFILKQFRKGQKTITEEIVSNMLDWANNHTYFVQLLCNRVYSQPEALIDNTIWLLEVKKLMTEQEPVFFNYRDLLTQAQWSLLKAIAFEGKVFKPSTNEFLTKHNLGGSATVLQSLRALLKKELVYNDRDSHGSSFYSVYDVLFERWIQDTRKKT
jgi:uncharacterized protein